MEDPLNIMISTSIKLNENIDVMCQVKNKLKENINLFDELFDQKYKYNNLVLEINGYLDDPEGERTTNSFVEGSLMTKVIECITKMDQLVSDVQDSIRKTNEFVLEKHHLIHDLTEDTKKSKEMGSKIINQFREKNEELNTKLFEKIFEYKQQQVSEESSKLNA
jgi:hypothetical protein